MGRIPAVFGGFAGAAGVALLALGAHHTGGANLTTAGEMLMVHAPLLYLLGLSGAGGLMQRSGLGFIIMGVILFAGSLTLRVLTGITLLPMLAPMGGSALILGWTILAIGALIGKR